MIVWGMLFVFEMIMYLWTKSSIVLFFAGLLLGGCLIQLLDIPYMNWQNNFIDDILKKWRQSIEERFKQTKKLKGGK